MRIVILGYYGHLNAGDDLLQQAMCHIFQDHELMFSSWFPGIHLLNLADLVVVGGGSIWPGHTFFQFARPLAKELQVPIMILGVSARAADDGVRAATQALIERAAFVHVRDNDSAALMGNHSSIRVGADLFWWMPWETEEAQPSANNAIALNLRDWTPATWQPGAIVAAIQRRGYEIRPLPLYFGSSVHERQARAIDGDFMRQLGLADVPATWSTQPVRAARFTIAMRFHALLVSIRLGRPVIGFDYHNKTRNFFAEHEIPELCVALDNAAALERAIERLEGDFTGYCAKFAHIKQASLAQASVDRAALNATLARVRPTAKRFSLRAFAHRVAHRVGF